MSVQIGPMTLALPALALPGHSPFCYPFLRNVICNSAKLYLKYSKLIFKNYRQVSEGQRPQKFKMSRKSKCSRRASVLRAQVPWKNKCRKGKCRKGKCQTAMWCPNTHREILIFNVCTILGFFGKYQISRESNWSSGHGRTPLPAAIFKNLARCSISIYPIWQKTIQK